MSAGTLVRLIAPLLALLALGLVLRARGESIGGILALVPTRLPGAVFTRLARTQLEAPGAIALTAALFAMLHLQYGPRQMALILADGLFYGLARAKTGSALVPLTCHMIGNAYAAWERLAG